MPPKIWRPKAKNNYKPIIFDDVDDDLYVLKRYGKAMKRTPACVIATLSWRVGMYRANHMHAREIVFVWYSLAMQCRNRKYE